MKKGLLFLVVIPFLVFTLAGPSYAWQGRMGGMGDPYGLLEDEADFLIHPAKIATGEGVRFYGNYRFTYTGVTDWDYDLDWFNPAGALTDYYHFDTSGDEYSHDALLGAGFPLGPGRMGIFFSYDGKRGDYDGDEDILGTSNYAEYDLRSDLDDFSLRLLYGLPVGGFSLGGEIQLAYRQEKNESFWYVTDLSSGELNQWALPYCFLPYDSEYWEALLKGSIEGEIGPADVEFTLRGGFIFGGTTNYEYERQLPVGTPVNRFELDGDVEGWQIGGDLWVRYPLADGLALPFLVRIDFQEKTRDGDGPGSLGLAGWNFDYENKEKSFEIEVGGGVDKELAEGTRIAAGIYYDYLQGKDDIFFYGDFSLPIPGWQSYDYICPDLTEHQVIVRLAGEREFSPAVALRMGLDFFYGWARQEGNLFYIDSTGGWYNNETSAEGPHWGIGASLGATVKFQRFTLEPFINAGYQEFDLDGDGEFVVNGVLSDLIEGELARSEWFIGGGFSVLFDL